MARLQEADKMKHENETRKDERRIAILGIIIAIFSIVVIVKVDPQLIYPSTLRIIAAIVVLLVILLYAAVYKPKVAGHDGLTDRR